METPNSTRDPAALMPALANVAEQVADATQRTSDAARLLQQKLAAIGQISAIIRNVARQSKLLALNASIEAVRSSGDGRGFGVVAAEMRSLAAQADAGAGEIETCLADALLAAALNDDAVATLGEAVTRGVAIVGEMVAASMAPASET